MSRMKTIDSSSRARRVPGEAVVEVLDEADEIPAERRSREVADSAEHGGREREQADAETEVETGLA